MKNPIQFLTVLLIQWNWAMRQPAMCKTALLAHRKFKADKFCADMVHALIASGGDWRAAAKLTEKIHPEHFERITKFKKWAVKITAPKKRGLLLEWKGGAL